MAIVLKIILSVSTNILDSTYSELLLILLTLLNKVKCTHMNLEQITLPVLVLVTREDLQMVVPVY